MTFEVIASADAHLRVRASVAVAMHAVEAPGAQAAAFENNPRDPQGPRRHRCEAFCYGPKRCPSYLAGPARQVPGRKGMTYVEEDEIDEDETRGRGPEG